MGQTLAAYKTYRASIGSNDVPSIHVSCAYMSKDYTPVVSP